MTPTIQTDNGVATFYPTSKKEWRAWLQKHHAKETSVWVVMYKKASGVPTISWSEAVDEALCFGWIDSTRRPVDEERSIQFFSKRKPKGTWSKINKAKIEQLTADGLMTKAGQACIDAAKQNGSWTILDEVEEMVMPAELEKALAEREGAMEYFMGLSRSVRKMALHRIAMAKRDETKQKRITEIADSAARGEKPTQAG